MRYFKLLFLLIVNQAIAQGVDFTATLVSKTCSGTTMQFEATFTPSEVSVTEFDFNDGVLPAGWDSSPFLVEQPCDPATGDTADNSDYFWATTLQTSGNNIGKRFVQTSVVDVSQGGSLEFYIRYGKDDPQPGCEDPERPNEEVKLQYSINNGVSWVTFFEGWDTVSNKSAAWYSWHYNDKSIPLAAQTSSTIFRWYQPENDGNEWDNWGLDDIVVNAIPPPSASWAAGYAGMSSDTINIASNTVSFTKLFPPSNQNKDYSVAVSTTLTDGAIKGAAKTVNVEASDTSTPTISVSSDIVTNTLTGLCSTTVNLGIPTTSDNCTVAGYVGTIDGYSGLLLDYAYPIGVTIVTWTVSDTAGNTSSTIQLVTVIDNEYPVLTIPADIITLTCSVSIGVASATDNCGGIVPTNNAPASFGLGITPVVWTVTDASGNTVSSTQLVTVSDTIAPLNNSPADIIVNTDLNDCTASGVVLGIPISSDNCTVASVTNNAPLIFPIGTTTVTWIVTDSASNTSLSYQTITVIDNSPPTLTPPPDLVSDSCAIVLGIPSITDNCNFTYTNNAPDSFSTGTTTVTWTASDTFGNTVSATQLITFSDATDPTINIQDGDINISADLGYCFASGVDLGSVVINDDCGISSQSNDAPLQFPIGTTIVTYTVTDTFGNVSSATQTITVVDNEPPVARANDISVSLNADGEIVIPWNTIDNRSTDNCVIKSYSIFSLESEQFFVNQTEITDEQRRAELNSQKNSNLNFYMKILNCANIGNQNIIYTVTDSSGNTASTTVNLIVNDNLNFCNNDLEDSDSDSNDTDSLDSDGDGVSDDNDAFPLDPNEWFDTDDDGTGNNADLDDDGDGFSDVLEIQSETDPLNINEFPEDTDNDGIINLLDPDDDNDGFSDELEDEVGTDSLELNSFPIDTDLDLIIDYFDDDDDNDGQSDEYEIECGSDPLNNIDIAEDTDNNGIPNCLDSDDDGDGFDDQVEIFYNTDRLNVLEFPNLDEDGDGVPFSLGFPLSYSDNCPEIPNPDQSDIDEDGFGDLCDNCPENFNPKQENYDSDEKGDLCDDDDDNDGQSDEDEIACGSDPKDETSLSPDFDGDGILDCFDLDNDNDGIEDSIDLNPSSFDDLLISQYVSDNGDGINDQFIILKIGNYSNSLLSIYTRSGILVYSKRNYQNNWPADAEGKELPAGSYFFRLDLEQDGNIDHQGWLYLTR